MESNRKRKGFIKGKWMSFNRSSSKPSSNNMQYSTSSKVKPNQASPTTASVGLVVHQDYMMAAQKQKVSFIVPAADYRRDKLSQFHNFFGVVGDVSVDSKAATYISSVQERFKLE